MDLRIIVESNIPFIKGVLEPYATVEYLSAEQITPSAMAYTDALVTRTRTRCDAKLLDNSRCSFIATATIGTDHIDLPYCSSRGVMVANAPGCNAPAVAQWVLACVLRLIDKPLSETTLGIIGVGHVGAIVERWASGMGLRTLLCDPPRAERERRERFVSIDEVSRQADIITFHTPLTRNGEHQTYHLANDEFFAKCQRKPIILNAARGSVVDTEALIKAIETGIVSHAAIDCWEGEPIISTKLLELTRYATPHIAGYSHEGKIRATQMCLDALAAHFGFPPCQADSHAAPSPKQIVTIDEIGGSYNPDIDTLALKQHPEAFEHLRNTYDLRHEP